jgi:hypothetical protein
MAASWTSLVLALLKLAGLLAGWARERGLLAAGADAAIGRAANETLRATRWGRDIGARIDAMDQAALDALVDALVDDAAGDVAG